MSGQVRSSGSGAGSDVAPLSGQARSSYKMSPRAPRSSASPRSAGCIRTMDGVNGRNGRDQSGVSVVVTGGAGYLGSVVTARLLEAGHRVTVLDKLTYGGRAL